MSAEISTSKSFKHMFKQKRGNEIGREDFEILRTLEKIKGDLDSLHNSFDEVTEPVLIDSCIFEIHSLNMKYKYYLQKCKERGMIFSGVKAGFNC